MLVSTPSRSAVLKIFPIVPSSRTHASSPRTGQASPRVGEAFWVDKPHTPVYTDPNISKKSLQDGMLSEAQIMIVRVSDIPEDGLHVDSPEASRRPVSRSASWSLRGSLSSRPEGRGGRRRRGQPDGERSPGLRPLPRVVPPHGDATGQRPLRARPRRAGRRSTSSARTTSRPTSTPATRSTWRRLVETETILGAAHEAALPRGLPRAVLRVRREQERHPLRVRGHGLGPALGLTPEAGRASRLRRFIRARTGTDRCHCQSDATRRRAGASAARTTRWARRRGLCPQCRETKPPHQVCPALRLLQGARGARGRRHLAALGPGHEDRTRRDGRRLRARRCRRGRRRRRA